MAAGFQSIDELKEVLDKTFSLVSEDPETGPRLKDADAPQRYAFDDVDLVVNVRGAREGEAANLAWSWSDEVDWEPRVRMTMSSDVANRYFQGAENVAMALAGKRIRAGGDVKAALALIPLTKPVQARYRALIEAEYPHLVV